MENKKVRLSVDLYPDSVKKLRQLAAAEGSLLKPFIEKTLTDMSVKKKTKTRVSK